MPWGWGWGGDGEVQRIGFSGHFSDTKEGMGIFVFWGLVLVHGDFLVCRNDSIYRPGR